MNQRKRQNIFNNALIQLHWKSTSPLTVRLGILLLTQEFINIPLIYKHLWNSENSQSKKEIETSQWEVLLGNLLTFSEKNLTWPCTTQELLVPHFINSMPFHDPISSNSVQTPSHTDEYQLR